MDVERHSVWNKIKDFIYLISGGDDPTGYDYVARQVRREEFEDSEQPKLEKHLDDLYDL